MYKKMIWLILILFPVLCHAQFDNLLKKTKDKVIKRVDNKVDKAIDKKLDELEGKESGTTTQNNQSSKDETPESTPETTKSFSRFDFVPRRKNYLRRRSCTGRNRGVTAYMELQW